MDLKEQIVNLEKEIRNKIEQLNFLKEEDKKEEEIRKKKYILPKTDSYSFVDFDYTNGKFTAQKFPHYSSDEEMFYNSGNYFSDKDRLLAEYLSYKYNYLLKLSVYKRVLEPESDFSLGIWTPVYSNEKHSWIPLKQMNGIESFEAIYFTQKEHCQEVCDIFNLKGIV